MAFVFEFMTPSHAMLRIRLRAMARRWKNTRPKPKYRSRMRNRNSEYIAPWKVETEAIMRCAKDLEDLLNEEHFPSE